MVYFCFLEKGAKLSDKGARISIYVASTVPTTWGIAQLVDSWNDVVARAVSNVVTENLINVGASWTMWFIPSWNILIMVDFPTPKTLLTDLHKFSEESLHITKANLFSTLIAFQKQGSRCCKFTPIRSNKYCNVQCSFGILFSIVPSLHRPHASRT